jgi:hypothetical protein
MKRGAPRLRSLGEVWGKTTIDRRSMVRDPERSEWRRERDALRLLILERLGRDAGGNGRHASDLASYRAPLPAPDSASMSHD